MPCRVSLTCRISRPVRRPLPRSGRGGGNRTPTSGFGDRRSTVEPTPLYPEAAAAAEGFTLAPSQLCLATLKFCRPFGRFHRPQGKLAVYRSPQLECSANHFSIRTIFLLRLQPLTSFSLFRAAAESPQGSLQTSSTGLRLAVNSGPTPQLCRFTRSTTSCAMPIVLASHHVAEPRLAALVHSLALTSPRGVRCASGTYCRISLSPTGPDASSYSSWSCSSGFCNRCTAT